MMKNKIKKFNKTSHDYKARKLGVKIIDEETFKFMIKS